MGKNKGTGKKTNVFKVAGAKSLKAKSKAKPFTGKLRKIKEIVRKNINKIDEDLAKLSDDMRKKKEEKVKPQPTQKEDNKKSPTELERERENALQKFDQMQF